MIDNAYFSVDSINTTFSPEESGKKQHIINGIYPNDHSKRLVVKLFDQRFPQEGILKEIYLADRGKKGYLVTNDKKYAQTFGAIKSAWAFICYGAINVIY